MPEELPIYINRWGIRGSLQPFAGCGMRSYCFIFAGNLACLEDLCRRYLTAPSGGAVEYRPLTSLVGIVFAATEKFVALDPPYRDMGWLPEIEASIWVLTAAVRRVGSTAYAHRLAWFIPYIFCDSPLAISEGREIYGFPKEIGWFGLPPASTPTRFTLDVHGVQRFCSDDQRGRRRRLLAISREGRPPGPATPLATLDAVAELTRDLLTHRSTALVPDLELLADLALDLVHHRGTIVLLKQVFDAATSDRACYQAIIETPVTATAFRSGAVLPGRYRLALQPLESHPIERDLGLTDGQVAELAYTLDCDVRFDPGRVVWKAPT